MIVSLKTSSRGTLKYDVPHVAKKPIMGIIAVINFHENGYLYVIGNERLVKKIYFEEDCIFLEEDEKWILDNVPVFNCDEIEHHSEEVWQIFRECGGTISIQEIEENEQKTQMMGVK